MPKTAKPPGLASAINQYSYLKLFVSEWLKLLCTSTNKVILLMPVRRYRNFLSGEQDLV